MLYLALILLFVAAALCLALSRRVATRTLGFVAAAAAAAAVLTLAFSGDNTLPFAIPTLTWATMGETVVAFAPSLTAEMRALTLVLLGGGALALLMLTLALAPSVVGFGNVFAWALLALAVVPLGFAGPLLLLPLAWALLALLVFSAARASGALSSSTTLPQGLTLGLLASLLLLGGVLAALPALESGTLPNVGAVAVVLLGCAILVGAAPFHSALDEAVVTPGALGTLLYGLALPLLGLGTLMRLPAELPALPASWRTALAVLGVCWSLCAAAGALRERGLKQVLAWMVGGQAGLLLVALGLEGPLAALAAPALLSNLALSTLAGGLAVAVLERQHGSDDLTQVQPGRSLWLPGLAWAAGAASALGLPPFWGFWGRRWLLESTLDQAGWLLPLIIAASVLAALAYLAPLAAFWRVATHAQPIDPDADAEQSPSFTGQALLALCAALPLLVLGLAPQLAWTGWLQTVAGAPQLLPVTAQAQAANSVVAAFVLVLAALLSRLSWVRRSSADADMEPVVLAPDALGESLRPLAWLGRPAALWERAWAGLLTLSKGASTAMVLFEQRFYLIGVLLAVICVMLLMAQ